MDGSEVDKAVMYRDDMAHRHLDKVDGYRKRGTDRACAREWREEEAVQDAENRLEHVVVVEMASHSVCIDYPTSRPGDPMVRTQQKLTATCLAEAEELSASQKNVPEAVEVAGEYV